MVVCEITQIQKYDHGKTQSKNESNFANHDFYSVVQTTGLRSTGVETHRFK